MVNANVSSIVLAAGVSKRFGPSDKLLHEIDGLPMIAHALEPLLDAGKTNPIVVIRSGSPKMRNVLEPFNVTIVENDRHEAGLSTSIAAGIRAVPSDVPAAFVILADMPSITSSVFDALLDAREEYPRMDAYVPTHGSRRGHPVLFNRDAFPTLLLLSGDAGAKRMLRDGTFQVQHVPVDTDAIFHDVDEADDLDGMRNGWGSSSAHRC